MQIFDTGIDVAASPEVCWRVLSETTCYGDWNPAVSHIDGVLALGATVVLRLQLARGIAISTPVQVDVLEAERTLRWGSKKKLLQVEHAFTLTPIDGGTRFRNLETWAGPVAMLAAPLLARVMPLRYAAFNQAFKRHCEGLTSDRGGRAQRA